MMRGRADPPPCAKTVCSGELSLSLIAQRVRRLPRRRTPSLPTDAAALADQSVVAASPAPLAGLALRSWAAVVAVPHNPRRLRGLGAAVAIPALIAAVLALHAAGPAAQPRVADTLPLPLTVSHNAAPPTAASTPQLLPRVTGLIAADIFQIANAASLMSIAPPPTPTTPQVSGPTLEDIERAQAGVAEAQLALQAVQQSATDSQIQAAQNQVAQAQAQLAGAHASVTPLPTASPAATATPQPTASPAATPAPAAPATQPAAPVAAAAPPTPLPHPYSDAQLAAAALAVNQAQQALNQASQYNASLAVTPAAPTAPAVLAAPHNAVPVIGAKIATPAPATVAPTPVDLSLYQNALMQAQANLNTMVDANNAVDTQNAAAAAAYADQASSAPASAGTADPGAATDPGNVAAATSAPATPVSATPAPAATAAPATPTPLPANNSATATPAAASTPTSSGTDDDSTATQAQSQYAGAVAQLEALQSPPPAEVVQAAQSNLDQAQQKLNALLQQASPAVAAQVDPDPMDALHKLLQGGIPTGLPISNGFIWPAHGPITQGFGMTDFASEGAYGGSGHTGIDIGQPAGQPIVAAAGGTVEFSGGDPNSGYGYYVELNDGSGYESIYGHMQAPSFLKVGDKVQQGQVIGISGTTGHSTGPHVHFEVRLNGVPIDPLPLLSGLLPKPLQP